jgi:hypothetical protein
MELGDKETATTPVAETFPTCVPTEALELTVMPPISDPATGVFAVTVTVHDLPAASAPPHGVVPLGVTVKYPLPVTLLIVTDALVAFLMVDVFETDVFNPISPKLKLEGLKVNGEVEPFWPVPVMPATAIGLEVPVGMIASAPLICPSVVGEKVTEKVHFPFAATLPLHGVVPLPTAEKSPEMDEVKLKVLP